MARCSCYCISGLCIGSAYIDFVESIQELLKALLGGMKVIGNAHMRRKRCFLYDKAEGSKGGRLKDRRLVVVLSLPVPIH